MYKPVALTFLFLLITFSLAKAQQKLHGRITEQNTGMPIAFATVQVKDAKRALSNENGEFELSVSTSPVNITVSHLNYIGISLQVSNPDQLLKISMAPQVMTLKEVAVGNPAIAIMQEVSDQAREHINQSFYRKAFLRQIAYSSDKPTYLNEIFFDAEWKAFSLTAWHPTEARHLTGSRGISYDNLSYFLFLISGYLPNNMNIKPLTKMVDSVYNFKLSGTYQQNGQEIAKIFCKPKAGLKKLNFEGYYYVNTVTNTVVKMEGTFNDMKFTGGGPVSVKIEEIIFSAQYKTDKAGNSILDYASFNAVNKLKVLGMGIQRSAFSSILYLMDEDNIHKSELNPVKINVNDSQLTKAMTYNETFWKNNQGIKRTEKEQSAIEILEKTPQVKK